MHKHGLPHNVTAIKQARAEMTVVNADADAIALPVADA